LAAVGRAGAETVSPYIVRIIKGAKNRLGGKIFEEICPGHSEDARLLEPCDDVDPGPDYEDVLTD
jgi:hypothetical protein